ncbi:MAG: hypothetical protein M3O55_12330 [Actinomycetota bacterium]|nr:hypothetical protein [Actinomycetota bacterium]
MRCRSARSIAFSVSASADSSAWDPGGSVDERGSVWAPGGKARVVFAFTIDGGRIAAIDLLADPERLGTLDLVMIDE